MDDDYYDDDEDDYYEDEYYEEEPLEQEEIAKPAMDMAEFERQQKAKRDALNAANLGTKEVRGALSGPLRSCFSVFSHFAKHFSQQRMGWRIGGQDTKSIEKEKAKRRFASTVVFWCLLPRVF